MGGTSFFYVLTKAYKIPDKKAAEVLKELILYRGVINKDKEVLLKAFELFINTSGLSLLDCFLCIKAKHSKGKILTFNKKNCKRSVFKSKNSKVNELAEAQKRTEEELRKLISEHRKTREQLGGLSHTVGYILEDRSYVALPHLLSKE